MKERERLARRSERVPESGDWNPMAYFARFALVYGCLGVMAALAISAAQLAGFDVIAVAFSKPLVLTCAAIHGFVLSVTFWRRYGGLWPVKPLLAVTSGRISAARGMLALAAANLAFWMVYVRMQGPAGTFQPMTSALNGLLLLSNVYLVAHWALQPSNLFPARFLQFIGNPIGYVYLYLFRPIEFHNIYARPHPRERRPAGPSGG